MAKYFKLVPIIVVGSIPELIKIQQPLREPCIGLTLKPNKVIHRRRYLNANTIAQISKVKVKNNSALTQMELVRSIYFLITLANT